MTSMRSQLRFPPAARWLTLSVLAVAACSSTPEGRGGTGGAGHGTTGGGAAGSGSAGNGAGCGGTGGGGSAPHFRVVSAELRSTTEINLVFSEAVADPSAVDPQAFHLSAGLAFKAGTQVGFVSFYSYSYPSYPPVTFCVPGYGIYASGDCPNDYCLYEPRLHRDHTAYFGVDSIDALAPGDQPNAIVATLAKPILQAHVYGFLKRGHTGPCGDLFLHYTEPSGAGVESTDGEALHSVGLNFGGLCRHPLHLPRSRRPGFARPPRRLLRGGTDVQRRFRRRP
jgi:hypothetical protein